MPAPVALFAFRRPAHTRRALESYFANPEARESELHVFCDGPRSDAEREAVSETRAVVRSFAGENVRVVERPENMGLARSVMAGVSQLCRDHGRAIVLEDDLVLAPTFLAFLNEALERYRDVEDVFSVSGYMFPVDLTDVDADAVFLPLTSSWGWATWDRAWRAFATGEASHAALEADAALRRRFDVGGYPYFEMLESQLRGEIDSWAIRWYATAFLRRGITLFPARSLVTNAGFDGTGVHSGAGVLPAALARASPFRVSRFPSPAVNEVAFARVAGVLRASRPPPGPIRVAARWYRRLASLLGRR